MTQAWLDAGNHKVNLKDIDQIEFLYNFFLSKGDKVAAELLQYDTLVSYRGKVRAKPLVYQDKQKSLYKKGSHSGAMKILHLSIFQTIHLKNGVKFANNVEMPMSKDTAHVLGIEMYLIHHLQ